MAKKNDVDKELNEIKENETLFTEVTENDPIEDKVKSLQSTVEDLSIENELVNDRFMDLEDEFDSFKRSQIKHNLLICLCIMCLNICGILTILKRNK